jgi:uncharacterized glyoxalase superfamily protein PhnB
MSGGSEAPPNLIPGVVYRDARAGMNWLVETLGFRVTAQFDTPDGGIAFAQLAWRNGIIFVSQQATEGPWRDVGVASICLVAEDPEAVETCHDRALAAGAEFVRPLHVGVSPAFPDGVTGFDLRDPEGHLWTVSNYQPR